MVKQVNGSKKVTKIKNRLKYLYFTPKLTSSLGSISSLKKATRTNLEKRLIGDFLKGQDAYTLHKKAIRKFRRRRVLVSEINQQFQADLIDVQNICERFDHFQRYQF